MPARRGGFRGAQPRPAGDRLCAALPRALGHTWNFAWRYWNVTKERRLGRGLEALLGQLPVRNETAVPAQTARAPLRGAGLGGATGALGRGHVPARRRAPGGGPGRRRLAPLAGWAGGRRAVRADRAVRAGAGLEPGQCQVDRQQSGPAAAGLRARGNAVPGREPSAHGLLQPLVVRRWASATSWWPASGGCGRRSRPVGPTCR